MSQEIEINKSKRTLTDMLSENSQGITEWFDQIQKEKNRQEKNRQKEFILKTVLDEVRTNPKFAIQLKNALPK